MLTPHTLVVSLPDLDHIKDFVAIISRFPQEMDLRASRYVVDAKSILGIMSLGPQATLYLDIYGGDVDRVRAAIGSYILQAP